METKTKLEWDYIGWKPMTSSLYLQKDWNQTLITTINQSSEIIGKSTLCGSANEIVLHPILLSIFETLKYYNKSTNTLAGRYSISLDENLPKDKIFVRRKELFTGPIINEATNFAAVLSTSPKLEELKNKKDINVHVLEPEDIAVEITVLNY